MIPKILTNLTKQKGQLTWNEAVEKLDFRTTVVVITDSGFLGQLLDVELGAKPFEKTHHLTSGAGVRNRRRLPDIGNKATLA